MSESQSEQNAEVKITLVLTGHFAKKFIDSIEKSGRSNRQEARLRMEDHLNDYSGIASIGSRVERK